MKMPQFTYSGNTKGCFPYEINSIFNAARIGVSTKSCTLYTMAFPCADCARAIIQAGITNVVIHKQYTELMNAENWKESFIRSAEMFDEAHVEVVLWDGELLTPTAFCNGEEVVYRRKLGIVWS